MSQNSQSYEFFKCHVRRVEALMIAKRTSGGVGWCRRMVVGIMGKKPLVCGLNGGWNTTRWCGIKTKGTQIGWWSVMVG